MAELRRILVPGERLLLKFIPAKIIFGGVAVFVLAVFWEFTRFLVELIPFLGRFDPWVAGVTDQRVIVRTRLFSTQYNDIALADIKQVEHDLEAKRLLLIGEDKALQISCTDREAAEILKALKGAYNPREASAGSFYTFWK